MTVIFSTSDIPLSTMALRHSIAAALYSLYCKNPLKNGTKLPKSVSEFQSINCEHTRSVCLIVLASKCWYCYKTEVNICTSWGTDSTLIPSFTLFAIVNSFMDFASARSTHSSSSVSKVFTKNLYMSLLWASFWHDCTSESKSWVAVGHYLAFKSLWSTLTINT